MIWFDELRLAQLARYGRKQAAQAAWLRDQDAVYLYGTLGSEAVLLRDGRVWIWVEDEAGAEGGREATASERLTALVLGAESSPEIRELLPQRPLDAVHCAGCEGSGRIFTQIVCPECSGVGWLPPAT